MLGAEDQTQSTNVMKKGQTQRDIGVKLCQSCYTFSILQITLNEQLLFQHEVTDICVFRRIKMKRLRWRPNEQRFAFPCMADASYKGRLNSQQYICDARLNMIPVS